MIDFLSNWQMPLALFLWCGASLLASLGIAGMAILTVALIEYRKSQAERRRRPLNDRRYEDLE